MNDREKAVTSERRNEGIRHLSGKIMTPRRGKDDARVPRTSSTLWMKDTICSFEGMFLHYSSIAQSVEHAAVNRAVVGSSPTRGATKKNL